MSALKITSAMILHHVHECSICTREEVAPNGFSRTDTNVMSQRVSQIHEEASGK